jgi:hypothetical protein
VQRARSWFISSYPLLGALASPFDLIEEPAVCARMDISIAAVVPESKEIFINPAAALTEGECRFVMPHELLHVGLRHDTRRRGRDPYSAGTGGAARPARPGATAARCAAPGR